MQSDSAEDDQFADDDRVDDVPVIAPRPGSPSAAAPVAGGSPTPSDVASRGLAGSAAYRLAGPDPDEPEPATPQRDDDRDRMSGAPAAAAATAWAASPPGRQGSSPNAGPSSAQASAARTPASPAHADQHATAGQGPEPGARGRSDASELFGPAWEAPRRYEAYPTLRTRVGLPSFAGVPRLAIAAVGLVLAAVLVFYFGPMLLGFGKSDQSGGGSGATPTPTVSASETPVPTVAPPPTPQVYIVAKGDTFSKIARKLGVTVEVLKAANPQIKNIDKIQIGDQVNIPQAIQNGGDASAQP
jgi:LysM repeat protein